MKLFEASKLAEAIKLRLEPMCERIEIAGSIRRARPEVNDIDLVILPRVGQLNTIKARCKANCPVVTDGDQNFIVRFPGTSRNAGFQVDLFFARPATKDLLQTVPGNFGSLLLCRTGSKEHNIFLIGHAKTRDLTWSPYRGVLDADGYVIASETEEDVFKALALDFVQPLNRER